MSVHSKGEALRHLLFFIKRLLSGRKKSSHSPDGRSSQEDPEEEGEGLCPCSLGAVLPLSKSKVLEVDHIVIKFINAPTRLRGDQ